MKYLHKNINKKKIKLDNFVNNYLQRINNRKFCNTIKETIPSIFYNDQDCD